MIIETAKRHAALAAHQSSPCSEQCIKVSARLTATECSRFISQKRVAQLADTRTPCPHGARARSSMAPSAVGAASQRIAMEARRERDGKARALRTKTEDARRGDGCVAQQSARACAHLARL
eukprot:212493-Pleurochrysis_carterae.AAC.7